jgi:PAS domain S-box-containing protein
MTAPNQNDAQITLTAEQRADLTEKALRDVEQRLRESEARFQRFADSLPQFIWESDADGSPVYVNQRWSDYSGLTLRETADAAQLVAAFHPEDARAVAREWAHARATATAMNVEGRIRRHDGVYRSFLVRAEPVLENGIAVRWFGSCTDITDLKGAEERIRTLAEAIRVRLEEHETLLAALPVGVFIARDAACTNITMNPAGAAMLRIAADRNASKTGPESERLPFRIFKQGVEVAGEDLPIQRAARLGEPVMSEELDIVFDDGVVTTLFEHARPLFDDEGRVRGCVGVFVDVTEKKRAEDALKEAGRHKDEFLAILAHELRNPLAALAAASHLLAKAADKPAVAGLAREALQRQVDHMARLLDDLLDVSRITHGLVQLRMQRVDVGEVVKAAIETVRQQIDSRRHQLTVRLPQAPVYVNADQIRLSQIVGNLLSNAAKYTDAGGAIEVDVRIESDQAVITVADSGVGIAPEMLEQVFEMFSQSAPALQRAESGLGVGLSLVRGLVHLHGGAVEARSAGPGQGSEFTVRLPLAPVQEKASLERPLVEGAGVSGVRILVADDNRDSANSWAALLTLAGHEVRTAYNGQEALDVATEFRPQLSLLDIGMPELSGYDVARRIREQEWGAGAVLVALTGWGQEQDKQHASAAGFDYHFTKPVEMSALDPILTKLSSSGRSR